MHRTLFLVAAIGLAACQSPGVRTEGSVQAESPATAGATPETATVLRADSSLEGVPMEYE